MKLFSKNSNATIGVTLMEILVVIGILIALLVPAISKGKEKAKRTQCINNLKQFHFFVFDYAESNDGKFPPGYRPQPGVVYPAITNPIGTIASVVLNNSIRSQILYCPSDYRNDIPSTNFSYLWNGYWLGNRTEEVTAQSNLAKESWFCHDKEKPLKIPKPYHFNGMVNQIYGNGSVQWENNHSENLLHESFRN